MSRFNAFLDVAFEQERRTPNSFDLHENPHQYVPVVGRKLLAG